MKALKLQYNTIGTGGGYERLVLTAALGLRARGWNVLLPAREKSLPQFGRWDGETEADLLFHVPEAVLPARAHFTMWETTEPSPFSFKRELVITPNTENARNFARYCKRVAVCPLFADTKFTFLPPGDPFTFLCVAHTHCSAHRKRVYDVVEAFSKAFPRERDVRLIVKQSPRCVEVITFDRRIELVREDMKREAFHELLYSAHVGVFAGSEGWGLPHTELMRSGRPVIAAPWGGVAEYLDATNGWPVDYTLTTAPAEVYHKRGKMPKVSVNGMIAAMQEAYRDRFLTARKGLAAAQRAADYTPARFAARLDEILTAHGIGSPKVAQSHTKRTPRNPKG